MVYSPTPIEQSTFATIQARLIELLLRHNQANFQQFVAAFAGFAIEDDPTLTRYRDLATMFHLRDELFEHILPRIVRRLSFAAPRSLVVEEPPARGQIDWDRTLAATWDERPGEPPLTMVTRQQRRDFAIPENLLTVVALLEYHQLGEALLWDENLAVGAAALRHPLTEIVERCERELAFPQFASLRSQATQIIAGLHSEYSDGPNLVLHVSNNLIPGSNSAYQDLIEWYQRLHNLQLLRRLPTSPDHDLLGSNPDRDNYLYQLWIFYELADLLTEQQKLELIVYPKVKASVRLQFRWGSGDDEVRYELRHDQAVPNPSANWTTSAARDQVPNVRPDFYLTRIHPPMLKIVHEGQQFWREPGIIWDAKYYRPFDLDQPHKVPAEPIKRMIADLALLGEEHGTLLFAFLRPNTNDHSEQAANSGPSTANYRITPAPGLAHNVMPTQAVHLHQLQPQSSNQLTNVQQTLIELLETAHKQLSQPRQIACHGMFLDTLSTTDRLPLLARYGIAGNELDEVVLCPKPHIGEWRIDLVHRGRQCCEDPHVCQIIGWPNRRKPIRPLRTAADLLNELKHILATTDELDEQTLARIVKEVESLTRQFASINNIQWEYYFNRVRDLGMRQTFDRLDTYAKESLALAIFLTDQLDSINAPDFSAPAIHIGSVMERMLKERVFTGVRLLGDLARPHNQTMGKLTFLEYKPWADQANWDLITKHVKRHWQPEVTFNEMDYSFNFIKFIQLLNRVKDARNNAAHVEPVSRTAYGAMQDLVCQMSPLGRGLLDVLLLAWQG
ncbi:MAG TPA: hypothetical protein DEF47_01555 [Herpetosiphon sp.]|uniref:Uncharacterized protein n=1 Tax=Herpetosiphon aurantiacus (strain ATCC 23779 / DSM 785 / 114-95) TaxID=316274 RepID=A9AUS1_HERA2|nr:hypothetical protein [Herpetosiphon sp.]ABX04598.1 conserved hypothetical protein [Herpetosiphon aurantiacus DSM 785]HBW48572.1 hypothetical protein [Herpetosiphon sp.]